MRSLFIFLGVALLFFVNLIYSSKKEDNILYMKNIEMLQVSAGEAGCKGENNNWCTIQLGSLILQGVGIPYVEY
jgi:hypothetical protein